MGRARSRRYAARIPPQAAQLSSCPDSKSACQYVASRDRPPVVVKAREGSRVLIPSTTIRWKYLPCSHLFRRWLTPSSRPSRVTCPNTPTIIRSAATIREPRTGRVTGESSFAWSLGAAGTWWEGSQGPLSPPCAAAGTSGNWRGGFRAVANEAIAGYDKVIGLGLSEVAIDGSLHKAPFGGEGTGPNPTDRGKSGWKWSIATDRQGVPFAWVPAAANENDCTVFAPTMQAVLARGLLADVETVHIDRGHDTAGVRDICSNFGAETVTAKIRPRNKDKSKKTKVPVTLGMGWPVERTNSWFSDFGKQIGRASCRER